MLIGVLGIGRDISERNRIEQELIKSKEKAESANKLKDAFIANISHEIRTPLTGILGMASLIRETFPVKSRKKMRNCLQEWTIQASDLSELLI